MSQTCMDCSKTLGPKNQSGRCRSCMSKAINRDPAVAEARRAALRAHFAKPGVREAAAERMREYNTNMPEEHRERRREHGRRTYKRYLAGPENHGVVQSADARRNRGAAVREAAMGWCPLHLRAEYRRLTISKRLKAAEARALIEAQMVAEAEREQTAERARIAAMTPFERQMERVRNGARVVDKVKTHRADHDFTLGGVATGML